MGLDRGILSGLQSKLGYDGTKYSYAAWNGDVTLEEAFRASCVWYYKKLMSNLDKDYVLAVLDRLDYGNRDLSVWNSNGHNVFWIESTLLVSPVEQVSVLEKIFSGGSGFSPEHVGMLKQCMRYEDVGTLRLYGKTGTGRNYNSGHLEGWLAGLLEYPDGATIYYAIHAASRDKDVSGPDVLAMLKKMLSCGGLFETKAPLRGGVADQR